MHLDHGDALLLNTHSWVLLLALPKRWPFLRAPWIAAICGLLRHSLARVVDASLCSHGSRWVGGMRTNTKTHGSCTMPVLCVLCGVPAQQP